MLSKRPPTKIVDLANVILRAVEQRNVLGQPRLCCGIWYRLLDRLGLHAIEVVDVINEQLSIDESLIDF